MFEKLKSFAKDQDGAITVDWVVLCAGVVGAAVAIVVAMQSGALTLTGSLSDFMSSWQF